MLKFGGLQNSQFSSAKFSNLAKNSQDFQSVIPKIFNCGAQFLVLIPLLNHRLHSERTKNLDFHYNAPCTGRPPPRFAYAK